MKRAFSMTELQAAIAAGSAMSQEEQLPSVSLKCEMISLRRSKSMGSLAHQNFNASMMLPGAEDGSEGQPSSPTEPTQMLLPSLSALGLSFPGGHGNSHGFEELKRSRGSISGSSNYCRSPPSQHHSMRQGSMGHDEETKGAAAALMDLFRQNPPASINSFNTNFSGYAVPAQNPSLPSLQDLIAQTNSNFGTSQPAAAGKAWGGQHFFPPPNSPSTTPGRPAEPMYPGVKMERMDLPAHAERPQASHQWQPAATSAAAASSAAAAEAEDVKHNKYCHFCQHVKVKKASSMLACENAECSRRFCEHCLQAHLQDPHVDAVRSGGGGRWECPICRKACCCSMPVCPRAHRHCKAYRYRQRRAEQAATRPTPPRDARSAAAAVAFPAAVLPAAASFAAAPPADPAPPPRFG